eukprot:6396808-Amphidinium_carterae.1
METYKYQFHCIEHQVHQPKTVALLPLESTLDSFNKLLPEMHRAYEGPSPQSKEVPHQTRKCFGVSSVELELTTTQCGMC